MVLDMNTALLFAMRSLYDLDCKDIGMRVTVIGVDHYNLDADNDGTGCDSY